MAECAPPSTNATPSIVTGRKYPGIAHEALTARATDVDASRPNTARRPVSRLTAVIHIGRCGQVSNNGPKPGFTSSISTVPSGRSAAKDTPSG